MLLSLISSGLSFVVLVLVTVHNKRINQKQLLLTRVFLILDIEIENNINSRIISDSNFSLFLLLYVGGGDFC